MKDIDHYLHNLCLINYFALYGQSINEEFGSKSQIYKFDIMETPERNDSALFARYKVRYSITYFSQVHIRN